MAVITKAIPNAGNPQGQPPGAHSRPDRRQVKARLHYLRVTPRKARLIADLIKGLPVNEAEAQLVTHRRRAAKPILKLLRSAVANAKSAQKLAPENLYIETLRVDQGPMLKRYLPRARGSASAIQKKMSHLTLVLGEAANPQTSRFRITVRKKTKTAPEEKSAKRKKPEAPAAADKPEEKKPGFFRRRFSRKSI